MIPYHKPYPIQVDFSDIFESGIYSKGEYVEKLEKKIKKIYTYPKYCIGISSCTQGIFASFCYLLREDINQDVVQIPSFIWKSLEIIYETGTDIDWIDIDKKTWLPKNYGYNDYSIGLHTFGNLMKEHCDIFDASHAFGAKILDWGEATVFSLAPTKLVTSGEGGIVLTNNEELAKFVREYRDKNARMSEFHAKIALEYLKHLDKFLAWKKRVFEYYRDHIEGQFQEIPYDSNYNTIGFLNINKLKMPENIEFRQYYEPLKRGLKNTDYVYENIICLPSWYNVDYKKIVDMINDTNKI